MKENITAERLRKQYTYDMLRAVYFYRGGYKGYRAVSDCVSDEEKKVAADRVLNESGEALSAVFGFTAVEMDAWNKNVLQCFENSMQGDLAEQEDSMRQLVSAAVFCKDHGIC